MMIAGNAKISKLAIDMMHSLDTKQAREYLANFL
jgi:hypothetical protein